jgi:hypothetical protein
MRHQSAQTDKEKEDQARGTYIQRKVKILQNLSGGVNIIQLLDMVRDPQSKTVSLLNPARFNL